MRSARLRPAAMARDWRKIERTMPTRFRVPNAFQASPAPRPVNLPDRMHPNKIMLELMEDD
jgi:hypothetical protein